MASATAARAPEVQDFVARMSAEGERIVREVLPAKMQELDKLLASPGITDFNIDDESTFVGLQRAVDDHIAAGRPHADSESSSDSDDEDEQEEEEAPRKRVRHSKTEGGAARKAKRAAAPAAAKLATVPCNEALKKLIELLRANVLEASQLLSTVKVWIQVNVPRIEDGNNFGVQVQEELLSETHRIEDNVYAAMSSVTKYFGTRARMLAKCIKYENVEDFRQTVREIDFMEFLNARICLRDLRNNYALLHDLVMKNIDRVKKPRGSASAVASMY